MSGKVVFDGCGIPAKCKIYANGETVAFVMPHEKKTLEINGAKVTAVDAWGQKTLAYEIKVGRNTYKSGYYFVVNAESSDDKAIKEFDRLALISQDIIRHLIINKED